MSNTTIVCGIACACLLAATASTTLFVPVCILLLMVAGAYLIICKIEEENQQNAERHARYLERRRERVRSVTQEHQELSNLVASLRAKILAIGCTEKSVLEAADRADNVINGSVYFLSRIQSGSDFFMDWRTLRERLNTVRQAANLGHQLIDAMMATAVAPTAQPSADVKPA